MLPKKLINCKTYYSTPNLNIQGEFTAAEISRRSGILRPAPEVQVDQMVRVAFVILAVAAEHGDVAAGHEPAESAKTTVNMIRTIKKEPVSGSFFIIPVSVTFPSHKY